MAENFNFNLGGSDSGCYNHSYADYYGYLYTWDATILAVPDGWHLATKVEWNELIMELGGVDAAADKMKDIASGDWTNQQSTDDSNSSGFSTLPAGRYGVGTSGYANRNHIGFWWAGEEFTNDMAWNYWIESNSVVIDKEYKTKGLSVRCVKD